mmetsp:Transcript_10739/g.44660  ORF Transcript_10739/g.44660 Transcript_10739/m.44660 type:complete len:211 (-) Transcript_10739:2942-3574(-)
MTQKMTPRMTPRTTPRTRPESSTPTPPRRSSATYATSYRVWTAARARSSCAPRPRPPLRSPRDANRRYARVGASIHSAARNRPRRRRRGDGGRSSARYRTAPRATGFAARRPTPSRGRSGRWAPTPSTAYRRRMRPTRRLPPRATPPPSSPRRSRREPRRAPSRDRRRWTRGSRLGWATSRANTPRRWSPLRISSPGRPIRRRLDRSATR